MRIARRVRRRGLIPLTPLVDVMLILLVFFMVTSSYLHLDMIGMAGPAGAGPAGAGTPPLLLRLGADGQVYLRGQALGDAALAEAIAGRSVILLPSGAAEVQSLVRAMELGEAAASLRLVRTVGE